MAVLQTPRAGMSFRLVCMLPLVLLLVSGCKSNAGAMLSPAEREAIVAEIIHKQEQYRDAAMRLDLAGQLAYWDDSEDFVMAADGAIVGGYDEWAEQLTRFHDETERWLKWGNSNVHVAVLSREVASSTLEFEYAKILKDGSTLNARGSFTNVFRKRDGVWKAVHANGTHILF